MTFNGCTIHLETENPGYENYPQSTALINISESLLQREELAEKADQITDNKIMYLKSLVEKAIKSEDINPVVDSEFLTNLMVGYFRVIVQQWRKSEYEFKFKERILNDLETSLSIFAK